MITLWICAILAMILMITLAILGNTVHDIFGFIMLAIIPVIFYLPFIFI